MFSKIENWKNRLIDTTKRNRLLYFKQSKRGNIKLLSPNLYTIFQHIAVDSRIYKFYAEEPTTDELDHYELNLTRNLLRADDEPATDKSPKELWRTLYNLRQRANESVSEKGIVSLHLAFGFLEWFESDDSDIKNYSPLILLPVKLTHSASRLPYELQLFDSDSRLNDDIVVNPTLVHKLKEDFGLTLPSIESLDLEQYLKLVQSAIEVDKRWAVNHDVFLGLFSFLKINMYKDLQKHYDLAQAHPIVKAIVGEAEDQLLPANDSPSYDELDSHINPTKTFEVIEADGSQQEAIQAAKAGISFVLQGPPGTGKSQTITNIIAECPSQNKKILFVSEKMAALEVVFDRLKKVGLEDFCLEAHSHKANKRSIIDELGRVLHAARPKNPSFDAQLHELARLKAELNAYSIALHQTRSRLNKTVFQVHGLVTEVIDAPDLLFSVADIHGIDYQTYDRVKSLISRLVNLHHLISNFNESPWRYIAHDQFSLELKQDIYSHFTLFKELLGSTVTLASQLADLCGLEAPKTMVDAIKLIKFAELLIDGDPIPIDWLKNTQLPHYLQESRQLETDFESYFSTKSEILRDFKPEFIELSAQNFSDILKLAISCVTEHAGPANIDQIIEQRSKISKSFEDISHIIRSILDITQVVQESTGCGLSESIDGIARYVDVLRFVIRNRIPSLKWFDESSNRNIGTVFTEAHTRSQEYKEKYTRVLARYDEGALSLDHRLILNKFEREYSHFWRYVLPEYRSDIAALKFYRKEHSKLDYKQARTELQELLEVRRLGEWLDRNGSELHALLGSFYRGFSTDWNAAIELFGYFEAIKEQFSGNVIPEPLQHIMVEHGSAYIYLTNSLDQLMKLVSDLRQKIDWIRQFYDTSRLGDPTSTIYSIKLPELANWIEDRQRPHNQLVNLYQTAKNCMIDQKDVSIDWLIRASSSADKVKPFESAFLDRSDEYKARYGILFEAFETDWEAVSLALSWAIDLNEQIGDRILTETFVSMMSALDEHWPKISETIVRFKEKLNNLKNESIYFVQQFSEPKFPLGIEQTQFEDISKAVELCLLELPNVSDILQFRYIASELERMGLQSLVSTILRNTPPKEDLIKAFEKRFWYLWLDVACGESESLRLFRVDHHTDIIKRFQLLDHLQLQYARARLAAILAANRPETTWNRASSSEVRILQNEVNKQRRHKAIRQLFSEIPFLLQTLKPCMLMSPLSTAQFLDATKLSFDLIIFDEASQICPEDAIGAIIRGKQLVVVGDNKQLPPTRFFETAESEDFDNEDAESEDSLPDVLYDSILDECSGAGFPQKMLHWHYRSKCESLIAFSNKHFYKNQLVTFPNPHFESSDLRDQCIEFVHVPDGVYVRGRSADAGANRIEARKIAQMVLWHFSHNPSRSLGVISFSQKQQAAIDDELRILRSRNPHFERFFVENGNEPFFIKNLENVQGDERDVIFFSVGYGNDASGRLLMNFGPLNKKGGERRLNVAVSRAKFGVKLVSSIKPDDLDITKTDALGVHLLKQYMLFAIEGTKALARDDIAKLNAESDSVFEEQVAEEITKKGYTIHKQVGCSGYRIDMAVVHPGKPGKYILGIECDGATYHSSKTARDRDRLRQQVLESLGWNIIRVWSTDWVRNPQSQIDRILTKLSSLDDKKTIMPLEENSEESRGLENEVAVNEILTSETDYGSSVQLSSEGETEDAPLPILAHLSIVQKYEAHNISRLGSQEDFYFAAENRIDTLTNALHAIVQSESPVHLNVATRRLISAWGIARAGSRIVNHIKKVVHRGVRQGKFTLKGNFLWSAEMSEPTLRMAGNRSIDEIAIEELAISVVAVVRDAYGINLTDLIRQASHIIGFDRTGALINSRFSLAISLAEENGSIRIQNDNCWPVTEISPPPY